MIVGSTFRLLDIHPARRHPKVMLPASFHPAVAGWFRSAFPAPTSVQVKAWDAIRAGQHTLISAPTGSGKTLAAFLGVIDELAHRAHEGTLRDETQILYVSPLKALSNDIEKNLRAPLQGIKLAAERLGVGFVEPSVGLRTGDTSAKDRQKMVRSAPDLLITTPESLYLMLTSSARETLAPTSTRRTARWKRRSRRSRRRAARGDGAGCRRRRRRPTAR